MSFNIQQSNFPVNNVEKVNRFSNPGNTDFCTDFFRHKSEQHDHALYLMVEHSKLFKMLFQDEEN
jgi:hypothetical protein